MKPNTQKPEKVIFSDSGSVLQVHHFFHSIQGEGIFAGEPALFIRLAGCNIQCPGCDETYADRRDFMDMESILAAIKKMKPESTNLIVISGGEPMRQNLRPLIGLLLNQQWNVQIETNGTVCDPEFDFDLDGLFVVCSPKTAKIHERIIENADAFKYVVECDKISGDDGLPLQALHMPSKRPVARPPEDFPLHRVFVQPMDVHDQAQNSRNTTAAINSCLEHGYTLCLQMHKLVGLE